MNVLRFLRTLRTYAEGLIGIGENRASVLPGTDWTDNPAARDRCAPGPCNDTGSMPGTFPNNINSGRNLSILWFTMLRYHKGGQ